MRGPARIAVALLALGLLGCGVPVTVSREDPRTVHRELTRNVLTANQASDASRNVLYQWGLYEAFSDRPAATLVALHRIVASGKGTSNDVFALAELSFMHAEASGERPYYLAAAVYAWAFLFPNGADTPPLRFDPRVRVASDIYNRAVTMAFLGPDGAYVVPRGGDFLLPFGVLEVAFDPAALTWSDRQLVDFVPTAELSVGGLRQRYRWPGIGAPLAASTVASGGPRSKPDLVDPRLHVPVTALLRMPDARRQLAGNQVTGDLELIPANKTDAVDINGRQVPLEVESTSSLAYSLAGSPWWDWELKGFFVGDLLAKEPSKLVAMEPYQHGRFPVVFVHGTASSPARWAQMINELSNDSRLRDCVQFWLYFYDTGNPISYSAAGLRDALVDAVATFDPDDRDPALRDMVVIGHSQGGLLTKMTAVDTGSALYDNVFTQPLDRLVVSDETRTMLRKSLFLTPLPFVTRVVFISTPHHGAYIAGSWMAQWVASFVSLPQDIVRSSSEVIKGNPGAVMWTSVDDVQGSVLQMTPGNKFVQSLSAIPIAPGVHAHSIIPVQGGPPAAGQKDGVVAYDSAHITPVDSELIVYHAGHSVQDHPKAIEEVKRILLEHIEQGRAAGITCGPPPPDPARPD
ncbi:MAG: alpha/beta hydrolase [Deltaproteobacteria bacterium]|nr:alpha/beta hydrolase [Deltaproteobacteria bacterium]